MKRVISAILLFCMIASMLPPVQMVSAETQEVTYELDTDGIDIGATYLILRQNAWTQKIITLRGDGIAGECSEAITKIDGTKISYFYGVEALEWTIESYTGNNAENSISIVHKHKNGDTVTNRYLKLDASGFSFSETQAPLSIRNNTYYAIESKGEYIITNKESGTYHYLVASTADFRYGSTTALGTVSGGLRFYKKVGDAPVVTYTLSFDGNGHTEGNAPESVTQIEGGTFTVPATPAGFGKADAQHNYRFKYWTLTEKDEGDKYYPGDTIPAENDITLYAQWEKIHYKVTIYSFLDTVGLDLDTILEETGTSVFLRPDGGDGTDLPLNTSETGVYTARVSEKGTYSVWMQRGDAAEDTEYDVVITDADAFFGSALLLCFLQS